MIRRGNIYCQTNRGVLSGYPCLLALHLSRTPSLTNGTSPPSCLLLDNPLYISASRYGDRGKNYCTSSVKMSLHTLSNKTFKLLEIAFYELILGKDSLESKNQGYINVCPSVCLSVCLSIYLPISLSLLSVCLSVTKSVMLLYFLCPSTQNSHEISMDHFSAGVDNLSLLIQKTLFSGSCFSFLQADFLYTLFTEILGLAQECIISCPKLSHEISVIPLLLLDGRKTKMN